MSVNGNGIRGWLLSGALIFGSLGGIATQFGMWKQAPNPAVAPAGQLDQAAEPAASNLSAWLSRNRPAAPQSPADPATMAGKPLPTAGDTVQSPTVPLYEKLPTLLATLHGDVTHYSLFVPYINQIFDTEERFNGNCACGPTSLAMVLGYYGRLAAQPMALNTPYAHNSQYGWAITDPFYSIDGTTFDRAVRECDYDTERYGGLYGALMVNSANTLTEWSSMTEALWAHGLDVTLHDEDNVSFASVKHALDQGHPVILTTRGLTGGGHLITVIGYTSDDRLIVNDSYGYKYAQDSYPNYDGENVLYTWDDFGRVRYAWEVSGAGAGWQAQYFDVTGTAHTRFDRELAFDWGQQTPGAPIDPNLFTARWTRSFAMDGSTQRLDVTTDGDVRVLVDGQVVLEQLDAPGVNAYAAELKLPVGEHEVVVEYRHVAGDPAVIQVDIAP